jgi:hypothetical protein
MGYFIRSETFDSLNFCCVFYLFAYSGQLSPSGYSVTWLNNEVLFAFILPLNVLSAEERFRLLT